MQPARMVLLICAVLACGPRAAAAAAAVVGTQGSGISVPTVAVPPPIDGTLASPVWQQGAVVHLPYDRLTHGSSAEDTTAYLLTDGKSLFVGFHAVQTRAAVVANQHSNMAGVDTDDEVKISLWPGGAHGFDYQFMATPLGTRYQYSSENLAYEPTWDAAGHIGHNEYFVTMRIPLSVMRGSNPKSWLIQLTRWEPTTGSLYAYNGGASWQGTADVNYAQPLHGMPVLAAVRPRPRVAVYGLSSIASKALGGPTSRAGADLSVPITDSSSFIATIHPDFSDAERDQQTIAPSAFRNFLSETRPFFTQGANFYNYMECDACPNEQSLYTPNIPTPRAGYAVEGTQGPLTFGGFDAVGAQRNDAAQSLIYKTVPRTLFVSAQRVSVDMPGFKDDTNQFSSKWGDLQHKFIYANYGTESGTNVTDPGAAKFAELGGAYYGPQSFTGGGIRKIGTQYNPYDGFFTISGIAGYSFITDHPMTPANGPFKSIDWNFFLDRYHGALGLNESDTSLSVDVITRGLWELATQTGSSYLELNTATSALPSSVFTPVTQNFTTLRYHAGTSTPTKFTFATGRYGGRPARQFLSLHDDEGGATRSSQSRGRRHAPIFQPSDRQRAMARARELCLPEQCQQLCRSWGAPLLRPAPGTERRDELSDRRVHEPVLCIPPARSARRAVPDLWERGRFGDIAAALAEDHPLFRS